MKTGACLVLAACVTNSGLAPSAPEPLPPQRIVAIGTSAKELRRMVPPEAYLHAYLMWFGGLTPQQVEQRGRPQGLFDTWHDYIAVLGLPDHKRDIPRQDQTNTLMVAAFGRLGEALCARAAEHDLHSRIPTASRVIFKFDTAAELDETAFTQRFDVLHRKFLGYPVRLAPADRVPRFFTLYRDVTKRHADESQPLTADEAAWAAVCTALVQHPEAELY